MDNRKIFIPELQYIGIDAEVTSQTTATPYREKNADVFWPAIEMVTLKDNSASPSSPAQVGIAW